jgi:hypothetical protein
MGESNVQVGPLGAAVSVHRGQGLLHVLPSH